MMPNRFTACLCALSLLAATRTSFAADARRHTLYPDFRYQFALIGDVPYDAAQETNYFPNMIEEINRARLAFVVHDGDIKAGATPCSEDLFERRFQQFQQFRHPLILIPGDNEWTDCPKIEGREVSQEEWLGKLRARFWTGDRSLGRRTLLLERQSRDPRFAPYRENVRWIYGGVVFAGLNVPGAANNFGQPEFTQRNRANIAWIHDAFDLATRHSLRAVMLIQQANPHFDLPSTNRVRLGFNEMLAVIEDRTVAYGRPVVLVHGDSHYFRIDQPLVGRRSKRRIENFTRVETYGNPDVHWLEVTVDWRNPNVFDFERRLVRKNFIRHR